MFTFQKKNIVSLFLLVLLFLKTWQNVSSSSTKYTNNNVTECHFTCRRFVDFWWTFPSAKKNILNGDIKRKFRCTVFVLFTIRTPLPTSTLYKENIYTCIKPHIRVFDLLIDFEYYRQQKKKRVWYSQKEKRQSHIRFNRK